MLILKYQGGELENLAGTLCPPELVLFVILSLAKDLLCEPVAILVSQGDGGFDSLHGRRALALAVSRLFCSLELVFLSSWAGFYCHPEPSEGSDLGNPFFYS